MVPSDVMEGMGAVPPAIARYRVLGRLAAGAPLGIVHRDVSLDNILVTFSGQTKLVDFAIAKAAGVPDASTGSGVVKGKVGYSAPEYLRGGTFAPTADLFALGVVLYRLLTAKRPFDGETDGQILTS